LCNQREANWEDRSHLYTFAAKRGSALVPAPKPGEKASDARQNLENEERDINIFIN